MAVKSNDAFLFKQVISDEISTQVYVNWLMSKNTLPEDIKGMPLEVSWKGFNEARTAVQETQDTNNALYAASKKDLEKAVIKYFKEFDEAMEELTKKAENLNTQRSENLADLRKETKAAKAKAKEDAKWFQRFRTSTPSVDVDEEWEMVNKPQPLVDQPQPLVDTSLPPPATNVANTPIVPTAVQDSSNAKAYASELMELSNLPEELEDTPLKVFWTAFDEARTATQETNNVLYAASKTHLEATVKESVNAVKEMEAKAVEEPVRSKAANDAKA